MAPIIHGLFLDLFGDGHPARQELLSMNVETHRSAGPSLQKAKYVQNVAEFFENDKKQWEQMADEYIIGYWNQINGVGRWTAQVNLMFNPEAPRHFPH